MGTLRYAGNALLCDRQCFQCHDSLRGGSLRLFLLVDRQFGRMFYPALIWFIPIVSIKHSKLLGRSEFRQWRKSQMDKCIWLRSADRPDALDGKLGQHVYVDFTLSEHQCWCHICHLVYDSIASGTLWFPAFPVKADIQSLDRHDTHGRCLCTFGNLINYCGAWRNYCYWKKQFRYLRNKIGASIMDTSHLRLRNTLRFHSRKHNNQILQRGVVRYLLHQRVAVKKSNHGHQLTRPSRRHFHLDSTASGASVPPRYLHQRNYWKRHNVNRFALLFQGTLRGASRTGQRHHGLLNTTGDTWGSNQAFVGANLYRIH